MYVSSSVFYSKAYANMRNYYVLYCFLMTYKEFYRMLYDVTDGGLQPHIALEIAGMY